MKSKKKLSYKQKNRKLLKSFTLFIQESFYNLPNSSPTSLYISYTIFFIQIISYNESLYDHL